MKYAWPHQRFSARIALSPASVSEVAHALGDHNPLHHDPAHAATTRYGRLLASGPQTTAQLMALTATHFSRRGAVVGLEFWFRFRQPVYADDTIDLEWLVISVKENARLRGEIIDLRGRVRKESGVTAVGAKGRVLVTEQLWKNLTRKGKKMPVAIRMARAGTKKRPFFHIVVADSHSPRDGRFIERLGYFNPLLPKEQTDRLKLDLDKVKAWLDKGATPSDRVMRFLDEAGIRKRTPRNNPEKAIPRKERKARAEAAAKGEAAPAS